MTEQTKTAISNQSPSRWQKLMTTLDTIDQAISYDPQEHRDAIIKQLWQRVKQLEIRVNELESNDESKVT